MQRRTRMGIHSIQRRCAVFSTFALAVLAAGVLAGAPAASASDGDVARKFGVLPLIMLADKQIRACMDETAVVECDQAVSNLQLRALIGMAGMRAVDVLYLSERGKRARLAAFKTYYRLWLGAQAFAEGNYRGYVTNEKRAIEQGAAASKLMGRESWFNGVMVLAGCPLWKLALRIPGREVCSK